LQKGAALTTALQSPPHPLLELYLAAADGKFPPVDGRVVVQPPLARGFEAVIGFTGHSVVATALDAPSVLARGVDGFGGCFAPPFLCWLAGIQGWLDSIDVTLMARGRGKGRLSRRTDLDGHPRVQRALRQRADVEVYGDDRGLVTLASGLAGRRELSIELPSERHGGGVGRSLLQDALGLVSAGEPVFAAVAPGNARSLRAFLGAGFTPLGSELLLLPRRDARAAGLAETTPADAALTDAPSAEARR
jgi:hypothetical protein